MRVLVTASRHFSAPKVVRQVLAELLAEHDSLVVVHGACPTGGDEHADEWACEQEAAGRHVKAEPHPADWDLRGPSAGPIRNTEMVQTQPDVCVAFLERGAENKGTRDCARKAQGAGIPTRRVWSDGHEEPFEETLW